MEARVFSPKQEALVALLKAGGFKRLNVLEGSVRSGKTWISLVAWALWVESMPENGKYLMAGKTLGTLGRNCLSVLEDLVGGAHFTFCMSRKEGRLFGRVIYLESANDARAEGRIRGLTLAGAYCDELSLFPQDFFAMLLSRLSEPGAKLIATTNPDAPTHWLNARYLSRAQELDLLRVRFRLEDNCFLSPGYVAGIKREYAGVFYDRYILGLWRAAEGIIYRPFADDPQAYLVERAQGELAFLSVGVDFGGTRSLTAFVATAVHAGFSGLTAVADHHVAGRKGEIDARRVCGEFVAFIRRVEGLYPGVPVRYAFMDSEAQYLIASVRGACRQAGLALEALDCAKRPVSQRIACASTLLSAGRLRVCRDCKLLIGGLASAVWEEGRADVRLDNFSTDIDILDAFEYSYERFMKRLVPGRA